MNLRLNVYDLREHAQVYMKRLGITYAEAVPQSIGDQWWFYGCENVPDPLPEHLSLLDPTPAPVPTPEYTQKLNECRSMAEDAKRARQERLEFRMADFDPERIEWLIEQLAATKAALAEAQEDKERLLQCLEDCVLGWGVGRPDHWADQDVDRWLADYTKAEQLCGEMRGLPDAARRAERGEGGVK